MFFTWAAFFSFWRMPPWSCTEVRTFIAQQLGRRRKRGRFWVELVMPGADGRFGDLQQFICKKSKDTNKDLQRSTNYIKLQYVFLVSFMRLFLHGLSSRLCPADAWPESFTGEFVHGVFSLGQGLCSVLPNMAKWWNLQVFFVLKCLPYFTIESLFGLIWPLQGPATLHELCSMGGKNPEQCALFTCVFSDPFVREGAWQLAD